MSRNSQNIIVSPASLAGALSVIERGGSPKLQSELHRLLGFSKSPTAWIDFDTLRRVTNTSRQSDGPLTTANALFVDSDTAPYEQAIQALAASGLKVDVADFSKPETLVAINAWVSEQTKGKISNMLDALSRDTALIAINALHFKDRWLTRFERNETKTEPFYLLGGETITTPTMHTGDVRLRFRQDERFVAVELPYATRGFSLVIVTTKQAPAASKAFATLGDWLSGTDFVESAGEVALPRFGAETAMDLMPALATLGFKPPQFLPGFAKGPLRLAKAQQRVVLTVDEEGTEAAAATAVTTTRSFEGGYVKMIVDKPFLFGLRDAATGLMIMAGYIGRPEASGPQAQAH